MLFFPGYLKCNPNETEAPAYTCKGAKPPMKDSCSPGPHYYVEPSMTRNGKYVAPVYPVHGLAQDKHQDHRTKLVTFLQPFI